MIIPSDGYADGGEAYTDEEMQIIERDELRDLLQRSIEAFLQLINECETNYLFGEDEGELEALDLAKDIVNELDNYLIETK